MRFDWRHSYGPITWPRDRGEALRIRAPEPEYWKATDLDTFDGLVWEERPADQVVPSGFETTLPPSVQLEPGWTQTYSVTVRRLRTSDVVGPGTILGIADAARPVMSGPHFGRYRTGTELRRGDTYRVRSFTPHPTREQLAGSTAGSANQRADDLVLRVPVPGGSAVVRFPAFGTPGAPRTDGDDAPGAGPRTLRRSAYARTWRLVQRLRARADTPAQYVAEVERYLRSPGFVYTERPAGVPRGVAPLEAFLFDTREGYCQHYSGAMALLLRMGGVPARVASGFSPGGYSRRSREWVVRNSDAHSWVEAWFDCYGWVTFDPTPLQTPARSQIAAPPVPAGEEPAAGGAAATPKRPATFAAPCSWAPRVRPPPPGRTAGRTTADRVAGLRWAAALAAGLLGGLGGAAVALRAAPAGRHPARARDRRARGGLRRSGRPTPPGTTLRQLEQRFKGLERTPSRSPRPPGRPLRRDGRGADAGRAPGRAPGARLRARLVRPAAGAVGHAAAAALSRAGVSRVRRGATPCGSPTGSARAAARSPCRRASWPRRRRMALGDQRVHRHAPPRGTPDAPRGRAQLDQVHGLAGVHVEHVADAVAQAERVRRGVGVPGARRAGRTRPGALERARVERRRLPASTTSSGTSAPRSGVSACHCTVSMRWRWRSRNAP